MFNEKIKPPLVLTLICLITCGLLVAAYNATYTDSTGVVTEKHRTALAKVYGYDAGFEMLKSSDGSVLTFDGVDSVLSDGSRTAFEVTANGYSTGGLHVLVGLDKDGFVEGVSIMTIGETPGVGTKVQDAAFLSQFEGIGYGMTVSAETAPAKAKAVWGSSSEVTSRYIDFQVENSGSEDSFVLDTVTGATFSSNGMYSAVKTALYAYEQMKGANVNG